MVPRARAGRGVRALYMCPHEAEAKVKEKPAGRGGKGRWKEEEWGAYEEKL